jgi:hypothetical protein
MASILSNTNSTGKSSCDIRKRGISHGWKLFSVPPRLSDIQAEASAEKSGHVVIDGHLSILQGLMLKLVALAPKSHTEIVFEKLSHLESSSHINITTSTPAIVRPICQDGKFIYNYIVCHCAGIVHENLRCKVPRMSRNAKEDLRILAECSDTILK